VYKVFSVLQGKDRDSALESISQTAIETRDVRAVVQAAEAYLTMYER